MWYGFYSMFSASFPLAKTRKRRKFKLPFGRVAGITCSAGRYLQSCRIMITVVPMCSSPAPQWAHSLSNPQHQDDQYRLQILLIVKIRRQLLVVLNYHHWGDNLRRWPYLQDRVYNRPLTTTLLLRPYHSLNLSFIDLLVLPIGKVYRHLRIGRLTV